MVRGQRWLILTVYFLSDFVVSAIGYIVGYSLTEGRGKVAIVTALEPGQGFLGWGYELVPSFALSLVITAFIFYFLISNGFYETLRGIRYSQEFMGIMRVVFFSVVLATFLNFLVLRQDASRAFIGLYTIILFSGLFTWRYLKRKYVEHLVSDGYRRKPSLIIGAGKIGQYLKMTFKKKDWLGVDVVGFLDDRYGLDEIKSKDILGRIVDYEDVVKKYGINETYITLPSKHKLIPMMLQKSNELGVSVKVVPEMYDLIASEVKIENIGSLPVMNLCVPSLKPAQILIKRAMETLLTIPLLILVSPLMAVIAMAIKMEDKGPVFFRQEVLGVGARSMCIYKFRSMRSDADDKVHKEYLKKLVKSNTPADAENGIYKLANDDRVTKVGKILRKYSLDELPQLWNVVKGDLALVGPRPPLSYEYVCYNDYCKKRLLIKPGLTGLWQVSGKNLLPFDKMIMLDIFYINEWSIWLDLKIILDTIPVIIRGKNC